MNDNYLPTLICQSYVVFTKVNDLLIHIYLTINIMYQVTISFSASNVWTGCDSIFKSQPYVMAVHSDEMTNEIRDFLAQEWEGRRIKITVNEDKGMDLFLRDIAFFRHTNDLTLSLYGATCRNVPEALESLPHLEEFTVIGWEDVRTAQMMAMGSYKHLSILHCSVVFLTTFCREILRSGKRTLQSFTYKSAYGASITPVPMILINVLLEMPHLYEFNTSEWFNDSNSEAAINLIRDGKLRTFSFNSDQCPQSIYDALAISRIQSLHVDTSFSCGFHTYEEPMAVGKIVATSQHLRKLIWDGRRHCDIIKALEESNTCLIDFSPLPTSERKRIKLLNLIERNKLLQLPWCSDKYDTAPPCFKVVVKTIFSHTFTSSLLTLFPREIIHLIISFLD